MVIAPEVMSGIFQHLTQLERLEIFHGPLDIDGSIYDEMTATGPGSVILPRLRILHLGFHFIMTSALLTMLESRVFRHIKAGESEKDRGAVYLESVYIAYNRMSDDLDDRMAALQGNGTHIEILNTDDRIPFDSGGYLAARNRLSTRRSDSASGLITLTN
ncbi:hypothetical protein HGRIS_000220 [Hohenbuehelia grisea]|uniref:Uncharacterized protein n=1 Tax=Hohenbuehelia grisea TaxID=104357 RepID=A0ABR3JR07_9AGAR